MKIKLRKWESLHEHKMCSTLSEKIMFSHYNHYSQLLLSLSLSPFLSSWLLCHHHQQSRGATSQPCCYHSQHSPSSSLHSLTHDKKPLKKEELAAQTIATKHTSSDPEPAVEERPELTHTHTQLTHQSLMSVVYQVVAV